MKAAVATDDGNLLIAGYDPTTKEIVYEAVNEMIIKPAKTQKMIEVSPGSNMGSDQDGENKLGRTTAKDARGDGISFVVTPTHDLYGHIRKDNKKSAAASGKVFAKMKAREILSDTKNSNKVTDLLSAASNGVRTTASRHMVRMVQTDRGIETSEKWAAFLGLYGFSFGMETERWLNWNPESVAWLEERLSILGNESIDLGTDRTTPTDCSRYVGILRDLFKIDMDTRRPSLPEWCWTLNKDEVQAVVAGLAQASNNSNELHTTTTTTANTNKIQTWSAEFRDELTRFLLHGGFAARFVASNDEDKDETLSSTAIERPQHRSPKTQWSIFFSSGTNADTVPTIQSSTDVREVSYTGRTWCVSVPHGFIITRRAFQTRPGKVVTKASAPIIMGNCLITHGCANFMRDRFFVNSDQYRIHICERCGLTAQSNLKKMTYECRTPTCVGRPNKICQIEIPYACKLLFQEMHSMCISARIYTEVRKTRDNSY